MGKGLVMEGDTGANTTSELARLPFVDLTLRKARYVLAVLCSRLASIHQSDFRQPIHYYPTDDGLLERSQGIELLSPSNSNHSRLGYFFNFKGSSAPGLLFVV